jgi:hypothetical protein
MFCPKCGASDQLPESYCRHCGQYLPDPDKPAKKRIAPFEHVKANTVLSAMTMVIAFTLSFLLFHNYFGQSGTSPLIYACAGFLFAIGCWNVQAFWRDLLLWRYFKKGKPGIVEQYQRGTVQQEKMLGEAAFDDVVPASVTNRTTRKLKKVDRSSKPQ